MGHCCSRFNTGHHVLVRPYGGLLFWLSGHFHKIGFFMRKYANIFGVTYFLLTVIATYVTSELKMGGASLSIAAIIGSSFVAAWQFSNNEMRLPSSEEKTSYARTALVFSLLVSLVIVVAASAFLMTPKDASDLKTVLTSTVGIGTMIAAFLIISLVYYFTIKWSFSWYTGYAAKQ